MSDEFDPSQRTRKSVKKSEALWMLSFSDMSLVLLCFFVLMISTMKPDKEKYKHIKEGMNTETPEKKTDSIKSVAQKIEKVIKKKKLQKNANITIDSEGLHIEFKDGMLFKSGSSKLKQKSVKAVDSILKIISNVNDEYQINIEGHTDDVPIRGSIKYPSNWELSASRAISLMHRLQGKGVPESRLSVRAYAHTRPKVPYKNLNGRALAKARAINRRVVIWIE